MNTQIASAEIDWNPEDSQTSTGAPRLIDRIPFIPKLERAHGPMTAWRLRRFYALLTVTYVLGLLPVVLGASPAWKAFGLGFDVSRCGIFVRGRNPGRVVRHAIRGALHRHHVLLVGSRHSLWRHLGWSSWLRR